MEVKHHEKRRPTRQSCVKVEVAVMGAPSLISLMVFCARKATLKRNVSRPTRRHAVHNELVSRRVVTKFSAGKAVIRLDRLCRNANPTSPLLS